MKNRFSKRIKKSSKRGEIFLLLFDKILNQARKKWDDILPLFRKVPPKVWRKGYRYGLPLIGVFFILLFISKLPKFLARAGTEILSPDSLNVLNEWENATKEDLIESDGSFASTTKSNSALAVDLSDPLNCNFEINSIEVSAYAYSGKGDQTISIGINNDIWGDPEEPSHDENSFSLHSLKVETKQDGKRWVCEDLKDLVVIIKSHSRSEEEGDFRVDKVWVKVEYTSKQPVINQRSYRWQYDTSKVSEAIKSDSSLKKVEVGEKVALRIQLDNTGKFDLVDETYLLQYATKAGPSCEKDQEWNDVTDTTPVSYSKVSKDEITTPETDTSISCGDGSCIDYVPGNWATEEFPTSLPSFHFTELGFTIDTLNALEDTSYCLKVMVDNEGELHELNGKYISFPEINFGKKVAVESRKELKALKEPKIKADKKDFLANETPHFGLDYFELTDVTDPYTEGIIEETRVLEIEKFKILAEVSDPKGQITEFDPKIVFAPDGHTYIELPTQSELMPGKYTLKLDVEEKDYASFPLEQDFTWGVIAINTNKATYLPGEEVKVLMTVLDDDGRTVCDADVSLKVTSPSGTTNAYSTSDGSLGKSDECAPNNVTYKPDFYTSYSATSEIGKYKMEITAETPNGRRTLTDHFQVNSKIDFDIEREGPVRIMPKADYNMKIQITPKSDYTGKIVEDVPADFKITGEKITQSVQGMTRSLSWDVDWQAGKNYELSYAFDAPDISPEFFLVGPLTIGSFTEFKQWQIASDEVTGEVHPSAYTLTTGFDGNFNDASHPASNAYSSNDSYASTGFGDKRNKEYTTNYRGFDFSGIPDGSVINSVNVYIERKVDVANGLAEWRSSVWPDVTVAAALAPGVIGSIGDTQYTTSTNPTSDTYWDYSMTTLPTVAQLKGANFGIRAQIANGNSGTDCEYFIDDIYIIVDYTPISTIDITGTCDQYDRGADCTDSDGEEIRVAYNGSLQTEADTSIAGTWSITGLPEPSDGAIITVFINNESTVNERATTITQWNTGDSNITDVALYQRHLVLGTGESGADKTLTLDEIALYDYSASGDNAGVIFDVNDTTDDLTVDNLGNYSDETLLIFSGDTFEPDTVENENINTHDLEMDGTITASGNTFNVGGDFTNDGTYTANTSTVNMNGSAAQAINGTTATAFDELTISNTSVDVSATTNFSAGGTVTVNASANLAPGASVVVSGGGTLTGSGTVDVSSVSGTDDFDTQYTITTKTLTNLTVDYTGTGGGLSSATTYGSAGNGGLTISGSISTGTQTAFVGGAFTVSDTFTPSGGIITMNNGSSISNSGSLTFQSLTIAASATVTTSSTFSVAGTLTNNASSNFSPSAGTITMTGGSIANDPTGTLVFNNLTVTGSPSTSSSFTINGTLNVNGGNLSPSGGTITMATVNWGITNTGTLAFSGLTISETPSAQPSASFIVNGTLTVSGSKNLSPSSGTITMATTGWGITNSGTLVFNNLTISETPSSQPTASFSVGGTLTISGAKNLSPTGGTITMTTVNWGISNSGTLTFNSLTIAETPSSQPSDSFSVAATLTVDNTKTLAPTAGTITMTGGTITNNGTLTFNNLTVTGTTATSDSFTVNGTLNVNGGDLSPSAGTITMATVNWSITNTGTLAFSGLTISETPSAQSSASFTVNGTLTVSGAKNFSPSGGTIIMATTGWGITNSGTLVFNNLTISETPSAQPSASFSVAGTLTVDNTKTLASSGGTITMTTVGWSISNSGTLTFNSLTIAETPSVQPSDSFSVAATLTVDNAKTLAPTAGTITMTGGTITNNGSLTFNNLTVTGTTNTGSSFTINGTLNVNGGDLSPSGGTITMATVNWGITNTGTLAFNGLTISETPSTQPTASFTVNGTLTVDNAKTLAPTAGTITMATVGWGITATGSLTFNGLTIAETPSSQPTADFSVAGTLTVNAGKTLAPTGGTITMTTTGWGITNGNVLTFNNLTIAETPSSQPTADFSVAGTLTVNSSKTLAPTAGTITMTGGTITNNSGTLTFNNLTITGATANSTDFGVNGVLNVNGGSFSPTGGTVTMNDGSSISNNSTLDFNNLAVAASATVTVNTSFEVSGTVTVNANGDLAISSGTVLHSGATLTLNATGTISGAGRYTYQSASSFPTTGTITSILRFDSTVNAQIVSARTYGGAVEIYSNSASARVVTLGTATGQTINFSSSLNLEAANTGTLELDGDDFVTDPVVNITGDLTYTAGGGTKTITSGGSTWTVSGNVNFTDGTYTGESANTLSMDGTGTLTSAGNTLQNLTLAGTSITLANTNHTVAGNLVLGGTTITPGSSTITMTGTANNITGGGKTLNDLTINPSSAGTISLTGSDLTVSGALSIAGSDVLSIGAGRTLTCNSTSSEVALTGTISDDGTLRFLDGAGGPGTGGTLSSVVRYDASGGNIAATTVDARTYGDDLEFFSNSATAYSITLANGTYDLSGGAYNFYVISNGDNPGNLTVTGVTNDPTVTIGGDLDFTGAGTSSEILSTGAGTWTVSGNVNFTDGTFTPETNHTLKMNGSSKTITSASQTLLNFEVSGGSVSNVGAFDVDGTFTISAGGFTHGSGTTINVAGNITIESGATFTNPGSCDPTPCDGTIIFDGDLTFWDKNTGSEQDMGDVQIGTSPDTTNLASDFKANSLTITADDIFYTNGYDLDIGNGGVNVSGTLDCLDDVETDETYINTGEDFNINSGATFVQDQSTVEFDDGVGTDTLITNGSFSLYNLVINAGATIQVSDALDVDNDLTITSGTLDVVSGQDNAINVGGSWSNTATFEAQNGTVTFDATSGTETINSTGATKAIFYNVILGTSGTGTWDLSSAFDVDNDLDIDYGTLGQGTQNITLQGNLDIKANGNFSSGSGTFTFDGSITPVTWENAATIDDIGAVTIDGATKTVNLLTSVQATSVTVGADDVLGLASSGYTLTISGSGIDGSRPFIVNNAAGLNEGTNSTVKFTGTNNTDIEEETYYHLELSPSAGAGPTYTLNTGTVATQNLTCGNGVQAVTVTAESDDPTLNVDGNFSIAVNATFSASSTATFTIAGNFSNSNTFTANNGTVTFDTTGTSELTYTAATSFYGFDVSTGGKQMKFDNADQTNVTHDLTLQGSDCTSGRILLDSTVEDDRWDINYTGAGVDRDIDYVDVEDSNAIAPLTANNSTEDNNNNNANWTIDAGVCTGNNPPNDPTSLNQKKTDDTVIVEADWTSETSVKFTAQATDPDASDTLYLCIEADQLGTGFSGTEDSCGSGVAWSDPPGTPIDLNHTLTGLTPGWEYHWQARVRDAASAYSGWVSYASNTETQRDFGIDNTGPSSGTVNDGSTFGSDIDENDGTLDQVDANWTSIDDAQSGLNQFEYAIGTTAGGTDIVSWIAKADSGGTHADSFETGNLTAWDITSIDVDDLYATYDSDAEYMGLYGLGANIDDTNSIYVQDNFVAVGDFYARFYLNPNSLTMASGDSFTLVDVRSTTTIRASVELYYDGVNHQVRGVLETGPQQTSWVTISSNSYTAIELRWFADASGYVSLWVNGSKYDTATGDTSSTTVNNIQMGMVGAITAVGTSGEFFFDQFRSNSSYNAPFASFSESITTAGHLHTGQAYFVSVRARNNVETTAGTTNSDGFVVLPTFTFTVVPSSINFDELSPSNSWTDDAKFSTTTASTNAYHGYITTIWTDGELTHTANPTYSILSYSSPNSTPTVWSGTGFGYTTTDYNLSGDGAADRFDPGVGDPKYAGFVLSGEGAPCADHTDLIHGQIGAVSGQQFTITYRVTVTSAKAAGPYETDIIYIATPTF